VACLEGVYEKVLLYAAKGRFKIKRMVKMEMGSVGEGRGGHGL
jgi:hypothetical protein